MKDSKRNPQDIKVSQDKNQMSSTSLKPITLMWRRILLELPKKITQDIPPARD